MKMQWPFGKRRGEKTNLKGKTVPVFDCESDVRTVVETVLVNHGYSVVQAKDSAEALSLFTGRSSTSWCLIS
jgi:CheY-like chemotaxis protein